MKPLSEHIRGAKSDVVLDVLFKVETESSILKSVSKIFDNELESKIFNRYDLFHIVETPIYKLRMNQ